MKSIKTLARSPVSRRRPFCRQRAPEPSSVYSAARLARPSSRRCQGLAAATEGHRVEDSRGYQFNAIRRRARLPRLAKPPLPRRNERDRWELVGIAHTRRNQFSVYASSATAASSSGDTEGDDTDLTYRRRLQYDFTRAIACAANERYSKMGGARCRNRCRCRASGGVRFQ